MTAWIWALWLSIAGATDAPPCTPEPPAGWVKLSEAEHGVRVDARYASEHNFTGAVLPGYHTPEAWLRSEAASALAVAAARLKEDGYGLVVYDAYRPIRATEAMVAWARRTDQSHLVTDGYIAARSGHNHGHTVDLSLIGLDGTPVDVGTPFDHFGPESHLNAPLPKDIQARRRLLRSALEAAGFRAYSKEWWHYRFPVSATTPLDVPVGCPPQVPAD
jgi:D-alanyl-D-alanine dipeptidase